MKPHRLPPFGRLLPGARRRGDDSAESGQAMLLVLAAVALLATVPVAMIASVTQELPIATQSTYQTSALEAASAGLADYISHLDASTNYWLETASNNPDKNAAFSGWKTVEGATTVPPESFRYTPDSSKLASTGVLSATISGRAGTGPSAVVRTIVVGLRRIGFLDDIYFTDYETEDPALYSDPVTAQERCAYHAYDPNPYTGGTGPDPSYCTTISFGTNDVLSGPVHSNDQFNICGNPVFKAAVTTADPNSPGWVSGKGCNSDPTFARANDPQYGVASEELPSTDSEFITEAQTGSGGCLYTGPTTFTMYADGSYSVSSPGSIGQSINAGCLPPTNNPTAHLQAPSDGVLYVQTEPAGGATVSKTGSCSDSAGQTWTNPISGGSCLSGDAIVADALTGGGVKGQLTIAADNNVNIDGNLVYVGGLTGTDVLGLIANNDVDVNHPANAADCGSTGAPAAPNCDLVNPVIDAAILALKHSFTVPNYNQGGCTSGCTLTVNGAIAQSYRGIVAIGGSKGATSGYNKNYVYDTRLQYLSPPYFINPVNTQWRPLTYSEIKRAY